ncbi:MAG: hypothetical protein QMD17_09865 [Rhodocyclaceae bacterium]|jgi:hypothetical protein|nr:hypothetical protein [Rhodocyclaceae bacterium]
MRLWTFLLLLAWLPPALAHHHHGITLDPAARVATPHLASAGDTPMATPAILPASSAATGISTANADKQSGLAPVGLSLLLLLGGWGVWLMARRSGQATRRRGTADKPSAKP